MSGAWSPEEVPWWALACLVTSAVAAIGVIALGLRSMWVERKAERERLAWGRSAARVEEQARQLAQAIQKTDYAQTRRMTERELRDVGKR